MHVLMIYSHNKSMLSPLSFKKENPYWDEIFKAIADTFKYGGRVSVDVLIPQDSYISNLSMYANPGEYRLVGTTRDENPKNELLEWWESGDSPFRGLVQIGDDKWDSRTVSNDFQFSENAFYDLYVNGQLSSEVLNNFRSEWNPKK